MIKRSTFPTIKSSAQVATAIAATTGGGSTNSDVATNLGIKRWIVVVLRQLYNLRRI